MSQVAHGPISGSAQFQHLCAHFEQAGGSATALQTIAWKISAHPELIAHATIFSNLLELLQTEVFSQDSLEWASAWRDEVPSWRDALQKIEAIEPVLRADTCLEPMFRAPRHAKDHPLLRHGVTRHPITAALFNTSECGTATATELSARQGYQLARAHVVAMYAEARSRAARGLVDFLGHSGVKEFEPVPLGAGPVGLALREFSLARYAPLICQLPVTASTVQYAYTLSRLQPDFSGLPTNLRADASRYFNDLQRYFAALPAVLGSSQLTARTRGAGEIEDGAGGHALRSGWVNWTGAVQRELDLDWEEDALPITLLTVPPIDEVDAKDEEVEGECPGQTRDSALATYHPTKVQVPAACLRRRDLAVELRGQGLPWSMDVATAGERARALQIAQDHIDHYLSGRPTNQSKAHLAAVGGILIKAMALYGWSTDSTAGIAVRPIEQLDAQLVDSLAFIQQGQITLLATRQDVGSAVWRAVAFLVPGLCPSYQTRLADDTVAAGRLRQTAFLLSDVGGLGRDLLSIADKQGRLLDDSVTRRALGVENKTARTIAKSCLGEAADPINEDVRANLTAARLTASIRLAIAHVSKDLVPAWMISHDQSRGSEARLYYTQVRAARLAEWHRLALASIDGDTPSSARSEECAVDLAALQAGWVGCRHVADLTRVRKLVRTLQHSISTPAELDRRSVLREYHNRYALYAWLQHALPHALRAACSGPGLSQTVEMLRGLDSKLDVDVTGVVDKHNGYQHKSRLMPITDELTTATAQLEQHNASVISRLSLLAGWQSLEPAAQRHFAIDEDEQLTALTPRWMASELASLGLPVPCNFGRALLRTEWLDQGLHGRWVEAHMGHFDHHQNPFSKHSSHDPSAHQREVRDHLPRYLAHLGLRQVPSLLVPSADRHEANPVAWRLPRTGLKQTLRPPKLRPAWWSVNAPPDLPDPVAEIWVSVRRHAAPTDEGVLDGLLWMLVRSHNTHARLLTARAIGEQDLADDESAQSIVDEVLLTVQRHRLPQTCVASWLRLLLAAQRRLQATGIELVTSPVAALTTEPSSPVSQHATLRLPDLAHWRKSLHAWVRQRAVEPQEDPRYWAIAIALSSVINGMVLDVLMLSRILEQLSMPGARQLHQCGKDGEFTFMEFRLPSEVPGRRQLVRWFLDPLTELLILQAPPFPEVPTLSSTGRYLNPFLMHHGTPRQRCPGAWRAVVLAARAFWSTRVPQHLVQVAQRGLSTTSVDDVCWHRIFGRQILQSSRPGAPPISISASGVSLTLEDLRGLSASTSSPNRGAFAERASAISGTTETAGVDIQHLFLDQQCAHPWLGSVSQILAGPSADAVVGLQALAGTSPEGTFEDGAIRWLTRAAIALLAEVHGSAEEVNPLLDLRRVASSLLPLLALELGGKWFDGSDPQAFQRVSDSLLNEPMPGRSRLILGRGLDLLRQHEPTCLPSGEPSAGADVTEDIEDPDHDVRVDAQIITIDEYQRAISVIRCGIEPPLNNADRERLEDMLDLGAWSLARPREYLQARLGDFDLHDGKLGLTVRAYAGHGLKTPNATRWIPLSLLAPADVVERLRSRISQSLSLHGHLESVQARRQLLFSPPGDVPEREHHDRLLALLRQVLRVVTGDPGMRVYSLRHASANWMMLALEACPGEVSRSIWADHPATSTWIEHGDSLRKKLLGSTDRTDRRASLAITKLMGHLAAASTFMHYLHFAGLLQLEAVRRLADSVPDVVMAAAARVTPATFSEQRWAGWSVVMRNARSRAAWSPAADRKSGQINSVELRLKTRWLSFDQLAQLVNAHSLHAQPLDVIGRHFSMSPASVQAVLDLATDMVSLLGASIANFEQDGAEAGVQIPEYRMNEPERLQLRFLGQNLEDLGNRDPELLREGIQLVLERTNRHHREVALNRPEQLRLLCRFLTGLGVATREVQLVLRRRGNSAELPNWALEPLGQYREAPIKLGRPDTAATDVALERWISLRFVDRRGFAIPNVITRALFAAKANIVAEI